MNAGLQVTAQIAGFVILVGLCFYWVSSVRAWLHRRRQDDAGTVKVAQATQHEVEGQRIGRAFPRCGHCGVDSLQYEGPSGGMSTNFKCGCCGEEVNVVPGMWGERIGVDQEVRASYDRLVATGQNPGFRPSPIDSLAALRMEAMPPPPPEIPALTGLTVDGSMLITGTVIAGGPSSVIVSVPMQLPAGREGDTAFVQSEGKVYVRLAHGWFPVDRVNPPVPIAPEPEPEPRRKGRQLDL